MFKDFLCCLNISKLLFAISKVSKDISFICTHVWCKKFGIKDMVFISANTPILFLDTNLFCKLFVFRTGDEKNNIPFEEFIPKLFQKHTVYTQLD